MQKADVNLLSPGSSQTCMYYEYITDTRMHHAIPNLQRTIPFGFYPHGT